MSDDYEDTPGGLVPSAGRVPNSVLAAAWKVMQELGEAETSAVVRAVGDEAGTDYERLPTSREQAAFRRTVTRALRGLAERGNLRRADHGGRLPDGTSTGTEVTWYTAAAWDQAEARGRERRAATEANAARWQRIAGRMAALGLTVTDARTPGADALEWLLDLAEDSEPGQRGAAADGQLS